MFYYVFDNFTSLDPHLLYPPLLGIPTRGLIPSGPTVFQITIPCKGKEEGVASLVLGLTIYNKYNRPLEGTPIKFKLRKQCVAFVTASLCPGDCQNGGTCNEFGACECRQGFHGTYCEIALCDPVCQNNGTCISPKICACPSGYRGRLCEIAACGRPCENGGHCLPDGFCWCQKGFYGDACEFKLERKLEKAERRLLSIMFRFGKGWNLSRGERRVLRKLEREQSTELLPRKDRKFLVKIITRERGNLNKKHKKMLRRYKKLIKKLRKLTKSLTKRANDLFGEILATIRQK
nr:hypothetical protein BaRGS_005971 [Batillaria attramentaria]